LEFELPFPFLLPYVPDWRRFNLISARNLRFPFSFAAKGATACLGFGFRQTTEEIFGYSVIKRISPAAHGIL